MNSPYTSSYAVPGAPVAEQLCVTTAIIGLLAVGGKAIDYLDEKNLAPMRETAILHRALQEVKQCRSAAHILYKTFSLLEAGQLPFPERSAWISVDNLIVTLTDTVLAISDLQVAIESHEQRQTQSHTSDTTASDGRGEAEAESRAAHAQKLTALCTRLHWHNLSMTMMMTIFKCPGESDAQNCRVGLERRMTRLLSSNSDLAARLRRLRDTYGIKAMARVTIPSHAPVAQNAPRLPADRTPSSTSLTSISSASGAVDTHPVSNPPQWSVLSGYSLGDIPILSMVPLPVLTPELREGQTFYTFDFARRVSRDLVELMQSGQGNSKMLRAILDRPVEDTINHRDSTDSAGNGPDGELFAPDAGASGLPSGGSDSSNEKVSTKVFKNPLRYRISRRLK